MRTTEEFKLDIIDRCANKSLSPKLSSKYLGLSERHVRRLVRNYKMFGVSSLVHKHKNRPSNNRTSEELRTKAVQIIKNKYSDFGPTLAQEYLEEKDKLVLSVETVRQLMIADGLWKPKQKKCRVHQSRERRSCYGELIQIDGSPHDWFEGRAERCSLLVFIDDATGKLMTCHFAKSESTEAYMNALSNYLDLHGRPLALYSDMHGVFKVNHKDKEHELTQFGRALQEFGIEAIFAKTPQAKGRVERANKTLQDRLVKALRLENISSIEEANKFMPKFINNFNSRFAVEPKSKENLHRKVQQTKEEKQAILSIHETRKITKNLTISYNCAEYQLLGYGKGYRLQHQTATICRYFNGNIEIYHDGKKLNFRCFEKGKAPKIVCRKDLDLVMTDIKKDKLIKYKPPRNHPWRGYHNKMKINYETTC